MINSIATASWNGRPQLVGQGLPSCGDALLNADDPSVAALAPNASSVHWFGVAEDLRERMPDDAALLTGAAAGRAGLTTVLDAELSAAEETDGGQRVTIALDGESTVEATISLPGIYNALQCHGGRGRGDPERRAHRRDHPVARIGQTRPSDVARTSTTRAATSASSS